ncbi:hypothetical protein PVAND_000371 [Polypedilum vanderplanki]|uniref:Uncharacterized protein n=1 Tax=Polypedilum vanderplanki TaxID=319348 RepID=A0A9J6BKF5_POLVA|nr:hypothetical protein PVAND_000371 [Polypedilum vanderplanki]
MSLKSTLRVAANARQFSRSSVVLKDEIHPGYFRLKKIQEHFQKNDGLPVHLKGGPLDKVLYGITVVACIYGLGQFGKLIYDLGFAPPKKD